MCLKDTEEDAPRCIPTHTSLSSSVLLESAISLEKARGHTVVQSMAVPACRSVLERRFSVMCIDGCGRSHMRRSVGLWRFLKEDVLLLSEGGTGVEMSEQREQSTHVATYFSRTNMHAD